MTITLFRNKGFWFALFSDSKETIQTPFNSSVPVEKVSARLQARNPQATIIPN